MAPANLEYSKLQALLKSDDKEEIYLQLMSKEKHVLDTINRVVDASNEKELTSKEFANLSLNEILHNFMWHMQLATQELLRAKTFRDFKKVFTKDDRLIYTGLFFVLVCVFLFFIMISTSREHAGSIHP
jgi:hypothetical protein